jgi:hypothetical protein
MAMTTSNSISVKAEDDLPPVKRTSAEYSKERMVKFRYYSG